MSETPDPTGDHPVDAMEMLQAAKLCVEMASVLADLTYGAEGVRRCLRFFDHAMTQAEKAAGVPR